MLLALAGAWTSGQLVIAHGGGSSVVARWCADADDGGGCASTVRGPWSEVHLTLPVPSATSGIRLRPVKMPVAFLGLAHFVFVATWFVFLGGPRTFGRGWNRLPFLESLAAAAVSIGLTGLMLVGAAPWCGLCAAVHVINGLLVLAVWRLDASAPRAVERPRIGSTVIDPHQMARGALTMREVVTTLALAAAVIAGLWTYRHDRVVRRAAATQLLPYRSMIASIREDPELLLRTYERQPARRVPLRPGEHAAPGRPQLVVFSDFQCPACACQTARLEWIREHLGDQIDVRIRHLPLCSDCNPNVTRRRHEGACRAAYAAEAARRAGGEEAFRAMHQLLFDADGPLDTPLFERLAARIGVDIERFRLEYEGSAVREIVAQDIALANALGVTHTPVMLLDGRVVPDLCDTPVFWTAIAQREAPTIAQVE